MNRNLLWLLRVVVCVSIALPQASSAKQRALVLTHVTVIDTTGGLAQPDATVVIRGDRIVDMGKSGKARVPAGSQVVDATGKFLIPGLWDMSVFWYDQKDYLPLFIANGVTGVEVVMGYAEHHEFREEIEAGHLLGPRMVIGTRWLAGPDRVAWSFIAVRSSAEARRAVIEANKYGADFIEVGGAENLPREAFFALADEAKKRGIRFEGHIPIFVSATEGSNAGLRRIDVMPGVFHVAILLASSRRETDLQRSWEKALANDEGMAGPAFRARMQLTLDTYNQQKAEALFTRLRANQTWFCPTLIAERNSAYVGDPAIASDPRLKYMSAGERDWWSDLRDWNSKILSAEDIAMRRRAYQKELEIVSAMRDAGVELLAGTAAEDVQFAFPGFSLHDELALLVQTGLTPMEALRTATLNPARFLGKEQDFGTVASGKFADLVLLDANPLQDIRNTRKLAAVVYRGKFYPRASLDAILARVEALASRPSVGEVLKATIREKGVGAAVQQYREMKTTRPDSYDFWDVDDLIGNTVGGQLLDARRFKEAIQIFELKAEIFPRSWLVYDWLGKAYMQAGEKELAIKSYKKSLELDPGNQDAALKLKQLNAH